MSVPHVTRLPGAAVDTPGPHTETTHVTLRFMRVEVGPIFEIVQSGAVAEMVVVAVVDASE